MIVLVIIGDLIGAGFASGQEIYLFFYRYGIKGIIGLIICSILIGIVIYKTLLITLKNKINNYKEFLDLIFYKKRNKFLNFSYITNIIINIFLLMTFYIMISGFGAYFEQEYNISRIIGATILAVLCYCIFLKNIQGVTKTNTVVVPVLIMIIIIIGIINFLKIKTELFSTGITNIQYANTNNWLVQSVIYCSYNMILLMPVLINLKQYINSRKQILQISIISSFIIFILATIVYLLLFNVDTDFNQLEMPAVYVIGKNFPLLRGIYGIVILLSIFTTSISIGISFLENVVKKEKNFPKIASLMCITSVLISNFGFSNLVKILFPVFGCLGLLQIIFLIGTKN